MNLQDIAIIGPVKKSKFIKGKDYLNMGLSLVERLLDNKKIKFLKHYTEKENDLTDKIKTLKKDHINLMTIHGSKGLEF